MHYNNIDAPGAFPKTQGTVRRVRMEWRDFVQAGDDGWEAADDRARYDDVQVSQIHWPDENARTPRRSAWTGVLVDLDIFGR